MLAVGAAGLVGWAIADTPLIATAGIVVADAIGCLMMLPKSWRAPYSETVSTYALASLSGAFGTFAVGAWRLDLLLYPAFFTPANGAIALFLVLRRRSIARSPQTPATAAISL